ncbi:hypothetical protein ACN4EE_18080 [Geminocystis sp. CENA526]|uniref:hypothetical protein n=1 Tax=Geminocystis sp. CENA526 TaxID=1355871 RepID=UPI003D6E1A0C
MTQKKTKKDLNFLETQISELSNTPNNDSSISDNSPDSLYERAVTPDSLIAFFSDLDDIPSDNEDLLNSIDNIENICLSLYNLILIVSDPVLEPQKILEIVRRYKEGITKNKNNVVTEGLLNLAKKQFLYSVKILINRLNKLLIKPVMKLDDLSLAVADLISGKTLNLIGKDNRIPNDDISNILKSISLIFPELKLPSFDVKIEPRALVNDLNRMANLPVITSGVKALRDRQWGKDDLGNACYTHRKADNSDSYITHYIRDFNDSEEIASLPHSEAIQILEKFGVYPALLHLILAVHFYKQPDPTTAILMLRGTDLIKDLGLDKRRDLTKEEKLKRVYETITAVRSLLIKAQWYVTLKGRKKPVNVYFDPYVMWDILPIKITDTDLFGNESLIEIEIKVRAGLWLDEFLSKVGKGSNKVFYSYATLSSKILDLDPYHEELALRIALLQSTMDYRLYYTVEQWLIENLLGAKTKISEAKSDKYTRRNLTNLWDNTLKALERIGFKIHFDNKTYPEEFRPDFEGKKPRGYFDRLLEAKIKLTPESLGKPESDQDVREAEKIPITPEKVYRGEDLKKARLKANISPKQIAKYLECTQGKIYNAEKRDNLSKKLFNEILDAIRYISKFPSKF